ncbi:hypothetical protein GCM10007301_40790 [Azorhizobium oxalatiphilum]|uniref:Uncharacterized protein n=1 Tax=Azorhizobium oxalatiphilum TaxID=980631 RepID=A0A917C7Y9_9HYPH|nr:hypothetical protein [Azorhizobium oxalatiphilum]GGF76759.1 hypothetical protein GCM10007301_40790 [Azorhizobium oxalatiphilum]
MARVFRGMAPEQLWQAINPWRFFENASFTGISVNLGQSGNPQAEEAILDEVGSYGRQLGRMGDALEVIMKHMDKSDLSEKERDALAALRLQLKAIRKVKKRNGS